MKCTEVIERLCCFADGECDHAEEAHIREHLTSCESCRRQAQLLEVMQVRTAQALHETAKAPDLTKPVLSHLPSARKRVSHGRIWLPAAAVFVLLAVGLGIVLHPGRVLHPLQFVIGPTQPQRVALVPHISSGIQPPFEQEPPAYDRQDEASQWAVVADSKADRVQISAAVFEPPTPTIPLGKITVDPNAAGTRTAATEPEIDTRLDQKITYEAKRKTVLKIVSDLSTISGVKFRAGYNADDWQVRDRKMNIFAKEVPLRDLMDSIARVMKFKWERTGEGEKTTYRLYMDRKTLLDAEAMKDRSDEQIADERAMQREKALNELINANGHSDNDLNQMKSDKPWSYMPASSGVAGALGKLISNYSALAEAIATGQEVSVDASGLSADGQQAVGDYYGKASDLSVRIGQMKLPEWQPSSIEKTRLSVVQSANSSTAYFLS